jgi:phage repressor protein C with HTH and peptisase S24 domain
VTQARKHTRAAKVAKRHSTPKADPAFLQPADVPDKFALRVAGDCLAPLIKEGDAVVVDKRLPYAAGDLVVIFMRPELVKPGELGHLRQTYRHEHDAGRDVSL